MLALGAGAHVILLQRLGKQDVDASSIIHEQGGPVTKACVFCRIAAKESPAEIEYEDDEVIAFRDLYPKAPVHLLIIPKRHIESIARMEPGDRGVLGRCIEVARLMGERTGYAERGYRVSCNTGPDGGQVVYHVHFHFTAGRR
jgi:histidine triad (HIT) family protein